MHVVYIRKGIRSKNSAPILFINTPGEGVLRGGSPTLSENGLLIDNIYFVTRGAVGARVWEV